MNKIMPTPGPQKLPDLNDIEDLVKIVDSGNNLLSTFLSYKKVQSQENTKRIEIQQYGENVRAAINSNKEMLLVTLEKLYESDDKLLFSLFELVKDLSLNGDSVNKELGQSFLPVITEVVSRRGSWKDVLGSIKLNDIKI